jgi:hypothetical protein
VEHKKIKTAIFLEQEIHERIRVIAFQDRTNQSAVIQSILSEYFRKLDKRKIKEAAA